MKVRSENHPRLRRVLRLTLSGLYTVAGVLHLVQPHPFVGVVPSWVPAPDAVVALTGIAELAGVIGLMQPWSRPLRHAAGWGLAAYALCVWPANVQHMLIDMVKPDHGLGLGYHVPRLAFQPVLIWLAPWAAGAIDWPFRRRTS